MSNDPNLVVGLGSSTPKLSAVETVMLASLNRAFTASNTLFKVLSKPKVTKAVKESTKLFESIKKAGVYAKELTKTFELTRTLIGMPGRTATQGLDMITSQMLAPISGAITQSIGQGMAQLSQFLGPTLQSIGSAVGGFTRQNAIGAGIGGTIGGVAGAITGIPGLGIVGGLIGSGIEALVKATEGDNGVVAGIGDPNIKAGINQYLQMGLTPEQIAAAINGSGIKPDWMHNAAALGLQSGAAIRSYMGLSAFSQLSNDRIFVSDDPNLTGIDVGGAGGGIRGPDLTGGGGGAVIQILEDISRSNQQIHRTQIWGGL